MATEELASPTPTVADPLAIPPGAVTDPAGVHRALRVTGRRAEQLARHYLAVLADRYRETGRWLVEEERSSAAFLLIQFDVYHEALKRLDVHQRFEELLDLGRLCALSHNRIWDSSDGDLPLEEVNAFLFSCGKHAESIWVRPAEDPLNIEAGVIFRPLVWDNGSGIQTPVPRFVFRFFPFRVPATDRILWEPDHPPHLDMARILRPEEPRTPAMVFTHVIRALTGPAKTLLRQVISDIMNSRKLFGTEESGN